jgi:hypothetical protein
MIYAIQAGDGGPIKFGVAKNPHARLRELQTGNPSELKLLVAVDLANESEYLIHDHLKDHRLKGEWFAPSVAVWNVVWALERQTVYLGSHELVDYIYQHDFAAVVRFREAKLNFSWFEDERPRAKVIQMDDPDKLRRRRELTRRRVGRFRARRGAV